MQIDKEKNSEKKYTLMWNKYSHLTRIEYPDKTHKSFKMNSKGQVISLLLTYEINMYFYNILFMKK